MGAGNRMKIAFMVDEFPKLSETFVLNQITGLLQRGYEVRVFSRGPGEEGVAHPEIKEYGLVDKTVYYGDDGVETPKGKVPRVLQAVKIFFQKSAESRRALLKSMSLLRFGRNAVSLTVFYSILPFLDKGLENYDVVHCHFGPAGALAALLKETGVISGRLITTIHGYDITSYVKKSGRGVYNHLFKIGDLFMPISERWRKELLSLGCPEEKIMVHHMGVDLDKFTFRPRGASDDQVINILTIARLVEKKGVEYGIRAVAKALPSYPDIHYKIIGDGPLRDNIQKLIGELNVENNIELVGWKSQDEIVVLMREADILLAPSVTSVDGDQEGIPVVLMEALAQGLPVLSTQHSGIPELIGDGESGYLVPERDVDALCDKLLVLSSERDRWRDMGMAGRKHIEAEFNIYSLNSSLLSAYERLQD
jgi:colanic acid/amylovoran/stewartan biosynthesis glycosyltransferase WcaL/AmsK/CpsK